ncbi:PKD domain-containing protein [Vibrio sp. dhg]|uniref:PKD domain-containing protein n=1 Tax=Vibrio sp. dhg TaxID=2163016 RepID=UPI000E545815|nr:PKD domain-containing protein [Vibrio sp. dhg]AXT72922.1 hypothetical protein DBX26_18350 [Vibrio sp. dhg]
MTSDTLNQLGGRLLNSIYLVNFERCKGENSAWQNRLIHNYKSTFFRFIIFILATFSVTFSYAEVLQYRAEGVVTNITGDISELPLNGNVGDPFIIDFSYDTATADTATSVDYQGKYPALSMTAIFGVNQPAVLITPVISTQSAPAADLWGITGCLPFCDGSTVDMVRLNFFLPTGSVTSDDLNTPPFPLLSGTYVQFGMFSADHSTGRNAGVTVRLDSLVPYSEHQFDYIDIGAPLKDLMQSNWSAIHQGASINNQGEVTFYIRDNATPLLDAYRYRDGSLRALGLAIPEGSYFNPRTFDINDDGLIIFAENQQEPQTTFVRGLSPSGDVDTLMQVNSITNTYSPHNVNNNRQMASRYYDYDISAHRLLILDGTTTRSVTIPFDPYELTTAHIYPVVGENGDVLYADKIRTGGVRFYWYNINTNGPFTSMDVPNIWGFFGHGNVDGINSSGIAVATSINEQDRSDAIYLVSRTGTVKIIQTGDEYLNFRTTSKINNRNQVLIAPYTSSGHKLLIVDPQVSSNGEILGPPVNDPIAVFENGITYALTTDGKILHRAEFANANKIDFNDRGEVVFGAVVCEADDYQDCYRTTILARPKNLEPANEAPVANAGADISIRAGESIVLDGTGSFDDNTPTELLEFNWTVVNLPDGSSAVERFFGNDTARPTLTTDLPGEYTVKLQVTDEQGLLSEYDEVFISTDNIAPSADAGADKLVVINTLVLLDGNASSDPEMETLSYEWNFVSLPEGSLASIIGTDSVTPSFMPDKEGEYEVVLTVSDSLGEGVPDTVIVTATIPEEFAEIEVVEANDVLVELDTSEVTTIGNQQAITNFLTQVTVALNVGDNEEAVSKLQSAISRVDGCSLRGEPDIKGKERDWITDCEAQTEIYDYLTTALDALVQSE